MSSHHGEENYNIGDHTSDVSRSDLIAKMNLLIDGMNADGDTAVLSDLVGDKTLTSGGIFGDIMTVVRVHVEFMKDKNELTEQNAGEVMGQSVQMAMQQAVEYQFRNKELNIKSKESLVQLAKAMLDLEMAEIGIAKTEYERKLLEFDLENIKPSEHELKKEQIEQVHVEHELTQYKLSTIEPANKLLLDDKHSSEAYNLAHILPSQKALLVDDHNTKSYTFTSLMPLDKIGKEKANILLSDDHNAKSYSLTDIMPQEKNKLLKGNTLLDDDHDSKSYILANLSPLEKDKMTKSNIILDDQHDELNYKNVNMLPLEKLSITKSNALLDDEHCLKSTECDIRQYYRDEMQEEEGLTLIANRKIAEENIEIAKKELIIRTREGDIKLKEIDIAAQELIVRTNEANIKIKELDIKTYELQHMIPAQVSKINAEISKINAEIANMGKRDDLIAAQTCIAAKECEIKGYYHEHIQYQENFIAEAKAISERVLAGWDGDVYQLNNSMATKKMEQMTVQNELYERQKLSFDDTKYQKLLATQVNFAAMIFADDDTPDPLMGFANSPNIRETHKLINPAAAQTT